jgi:hypothetical protein
MNISQITLYSTTALTLRQKKDGSEMFDPTTLVLIGTGLSSLFLAFIEYAYQRKKRTKNEAA